MNTTSAGPAKQGHDIVTPPHTTSLPDAHPSSDRFRCGGRDSKFLAGRLLAAVVACGMVLAPNFVSTASAAIRVNDSFIGNASALLDLHPTRTLAAINFYDTGHAAANAGANYTVGTIQGKEFYNYNLHLVETAGGLNNTPINIGSGIYTNSGFTFTHNHINNTDPSRYFNTGQLTGAAKSQIGTFSPVSADNTQAERLAQAGMYFNSSGAVNPMFFAFGATHSNKLVKISVIGGGIWAHTNTHMTGIRYSVGGDPKAEVYNDNFGEFLDIATFEAQLDSIGSLRLDLLRIQTGANTRWSMLSGITITEVVSEPPPAIIITQSSYDANNDQLTLIWNSTPGATYTIENTTQLVGNGAGTVWDNLTPDISSGGTTTTNVVDFPSPGSYYRIRKQ